MEMERKVFKTSRSHVLVLPPKALKHIKAKRGSLLRISLEKLNGEEVVILRRKDGNSGS